MTDSSGSDCVIVTITPRPIIVLMIWATGKPSAAESSFTETPEGTVTGPVGGAIGAPFGWRSPPRGPWRSPGRDGRAAGLSITTRRLRPGAP